MAAAAALVAATTVASAAWLSGVAAPDGESSSVGPRVWWKMANGGFSCRDESGPSKQFLVAVGEKAAATCRQSLR